MSPADIENLLASVRCQNYPLSVDQAQASAIVDCIRNIMAFVSEDDQVLVRADYAGATSALLHPCEPKEER